MGSPLAIKELAACCVIKAFSCAMPRPMRWAESAWLDPASHLPPPRNPALGIQSTAARAAGQIGASVSLRDCWPT